MQMLSHEDVQQNESTEQMLATQLVDAGGTSQPAVSLAPAVHSVWLQVPRDDGHVRLFATV